jgi:hypothetical protein
MLRLIFILILRNGKYLSKTVWVQNTSDKFAFCLYKFIRKMIPLWNIKQFKLGKNDKMGNSLKYFPYFIFCFPIFKITIMNKWQNWAGKENKNLNNKLK